MATPSDKQETESVLTRELTRAIEPLQTAYKDGPDGIMDLLDAAGIGQAVMGKEVNKVYDTLENVDSEFQTVEKFVNGTLSVWEKKERKQLTDALGGAFSEAKKLDDLQFQNPEIEHLGELLLDYLLIRYLDTYHRDVHNFLCIFGIIDEDTPYGLGDLKLGEMANTIKNPQQVPQTVFNWANEQEDFLAFLLLYYLKEIFWDWGVPASLESPSAGNVEKLTDTNDLKNLKDVSDESDLDPQLRIPILLLDDNGSRFLAGLTLVPLPGESDNLPGLAIVPFGNLGSDNKWSIGGGWTFNVKATGQIENKGFAVRPRSDGDVDANLVSLDQNAPPTELEATAELERDTSPGGDPTVLLGSTDTSRIAVGSVAARTTIRYTEDEFVFEIEFPTTGTLGVHPADLGGFLSTVLPDDGFFYDFDATIGWSTKRGLYIKGGNAFEASIPLNATAGPVTLREIYLAILPDTQTGGLTLVGAASGDLELGPVYGTVKRIGVLADVTFPDDKDGNLGVVNVELGFKPPEGIGLSIDGKAVIGGGYLGYDEANERYAGTLQLQIGDITVTAVGLLTTELPSGEDGFSLLVLITGEFPPIELGLGFTLNGLGGLVGVHRSMQTDPLRTAVRTGSLDSVLFPKNPVANAQRIISDLRTAFPPTKDHHVFGPMAKIGWGEPTLITADLGIVLELPSGEIAILGRISSVLPNDDARLIVLNMDVLGVVNPPAQRASIDASLYDSRVVQWSVTGDMAMRSRWGDKSRFVLSVGGFNPRFDPPADFPELRRVRLTLGNPSGNPSVEIAGYFAVTSNTVQTGSHVHVQVEAGPASIEGHLGIDALFHFDPFKFIVDFLATLTIEAYGSTVSASVDGTVSGPSPWRIKGSVQIDNKYFSLKESFNVVLGPAKQTESLPSANVLPEVVDELERPTNWSAQRPGAGNAVAVFRDIERTGSEVLVHPLGSLAVRQTVVPLDGFRVEKFGNATPSPYTQFEITSAGIVGSTATTLNLGESMNEEFAPAQYTKMTDQEKLDSPAFESHVAGRRMDAEGVYPGWNSDSNTPGKAKNTRSMTLTYESTVIDRASNDLGSGSRTAGSVPQAWTDQLVNVGAVANADTRTTGQQQFMLSNDEISAIHGQGGGSSGAATDGGAVAADRVGLGARISMTDPTYVIVRTDTLERADLDAVSGETPMSKTQARRALSRYLESHPAERGRYKVMSTEAAQDAVTAPVTEMAVEAPSAPEAASIRPRSREDEEYAVPPERPAPDDLDEHELSVDDVSDRVEALLLSVERHCRTTDRALTDLSNAIDRDDSEAIDALINDHPTLEEYAISIGRHTFAPLSETLLKLTAESRGTSSPADTSVERVEQWLADVRDHWVTLTETVATAEDALRAPEPDRDAARQSIAQSARTVSRLFAVVSRMRDDLDLPPPTDRVRGTSRSQHLDDGSEETTESAVSDRDRGWDR